MVWQDSSLLWLLLLIPLAGGVIWWYQQYQLSNLSQFFDQRLLSQLRKGFWEFGQRLRLMLIFGSFFFFIIGLAGPKIGTEVRDVEMSGVDMLVILDLSRSMNAEDIRPSRLEKAKLELQRLINRSRGDRIGLLVFTGEAFVQSPITQDHSALRMFLDIAETHQMPSTTTNFGAAFEKAKMGFDRLEEQREAARVILMISDGENQGSSYSNALDSLTDDGVTVFTVGIGTEEGGRIPIYQNRSGNLIGYHRDNNGREVVSQLASETLRDIATRGNGNYYEISSQTGGIDSFFTRLDELQRGEYSIEEYADYRNRYQILVLIGLGLLISGLIVPEYRKEE